MLENQVRDLLYDLDQAQLAFGLEQLTFFELQAFLQQIQKYTPSLVNNLRHLLVSQKNPNNLDLQPCTHFTRSGDPQNALFGEELIRQKKVGCLILAGGQGTRLGFNGPKGIMPILNEKSLFHLLCMRAKDKGPLCIMTSPCNHAQTVDFFAHHQDFAISELFFFQQEMLPFLDNHGNWMLEKPGLIAEGPDGNGHALHLFFQRGIWQQFSDLGITHLNVIFVDNALADPFDAEFIGLTAKSQSDVGIKVIDRIAHDQSMGALVEKNGKLKVIEYSELPPSFPATFSHTGMFCLPMSFIQKLSQYEFPLHLARKTAKILLGTAKGTTQEIAQVWKCERFLFDLLDYATSTTLFVCPRENIYAPLKNARGDKSLETVREAIVNLFEF